MINEYKAYAQMLHYLPTFFGMFFKYQDHIALERGVTSITSQNITNQEVDSVIESINLCPLTMLVVATINLYPENTCNQLVTKTSSRVPFSSIFTS